MDTSTVILHIGIILIVARLFGEAAAYFLVPAVIGELTAGILLGPSLLGLIEADGVIQIFAEVGIILLLFGVTIYQLLVKAKMSILLNQLMV